MVLMYRYQGHLGHEADGLFCLVVEGSEHVPTIPIEVFFGGGANIREGDEIVIIARPGEVIIRTLELAEANRRRESTHQLIDRAHDDPGSLKGKILRLTHTNEAVEEFVIESVAAKNLSLVVHLLQDPRVASVVPISALYDSDQLVEIVGLADSFDV